MKKVLCFLSMSFMLLAMFTGAFFVHETENVEARVSLLEDYGCSSNDVLANGSCSKSYSYNGEKVGRVTVTKAGEIKIEYKYGYSELLIYARACSDVTKDGKGNFMCSSKNKWTKNPKIIHMSGDYAKKGTLDPETQMTSKSVHLYNYYDYDELVKFNIIIDFATKSNYSYPNDTDINSSNFNAIDNKGFFIPSFCNRSTGTPKCENGKFNGNVETNSVKTRIKNFAEYMSASCESQCSNTDASILNNSNSYQIVYVDRAQLVYAGNEYEGEANAQLAFGMANNNFEFMTANGAKGDVTVLVDNSLVGAASGGFEAKVFETIIPAMLVILVMAAGITIVVLGVKIVKSADEPQERAEKIRALKNILISLAFVFVLLAVAEPLTKLVETWLK